MFDISIFCLTFHSVLQSQAFAQASLRHEPFFFACEEHLPVRPSELRSHLCCKKCKEILCLTGRTYRRTLDALIARIHRHKSAVQADTRIDVATGCKLSYSTPWIYYCRPWSMVFVGFKESFAPENSWVLWHVQSGVIRVKWMCCLWRHVRA